MILFRERKPLILCMNSRLSYKLSRTRETPSRKGHTSELACCSQSVSVEHLPRWLDLHWESTLSLTGMRWNHGLGLFVSIILLYSKLVCVRVEAWYLMIGSWYFLATRHDFAYTTAYGMF